MSTGEGKSFSWIETKYDGGEFGYFCEGVRAVSRLSKLLRR